MRCLVLPFRLKGLSLSVSSTWWLRLCLNLLYHSSQLKSVCVRRVDPTLGTVLSEESARRVSHRLNRVVLAGCRVNLAGKEEVLVTPQVDNVPG